MSRDIPVIFSAPMIHALIAGTKHQTRRMAWRSETDTKSMAFVCDGEKPHPLSKPAKNVSVQMAGRYWLRPTLWQQVKVGDRLYVRERASQAGWDPGGDYEWLSIKYAATGDCKVVRTPFPGISKPFKTNGDIPSIHMPRWASRLTLIVTGVKVEPLQDISDADARAEGFQRLEGLRGPDVEEVHRDAARDWFSDLWTNLHGAESWRANPDVVVVSFSIIKANIDAPEARAA
ncbi:MAG: hypothetical protein H0V63_07670 [Burkholderiaceae bacterium]|nr:hypothetical protein [Burkholderiaceae bacterium]